MRSSVASEPGVSQYCLNKEVTRKSPKSLEMSFLEPRNWALNPMVSYESDDIWGLHFRKPLMDRVTLKFYPQCDLRALQLLQEYFMRGLLGGLR